MASGCGRVTVYLSSRSYWSCPQRFAASISSSSAWAEIFTPGTATRLRSVRSATLFSARLLVISRNGMDWMALSASTSCPVPAVLSHSVSRAVAPAPAKS